MTHDAQQAADAAMVEILDRSPQEEGTECIWISARWLRTFLANFFAGWQAEIGGEQADRSAGDADARHVISSDAHPVVKPLRGGDPQPATPIYTEALSTTLIEWAERRPSMLDTSAALAWIKECDSILDTALTEQEAEEVSGDE